MELIRCMNLSGGYGNAGMRPERRLSGRNLSLALFSFANFPAWLDRTTNVLIPLDN
jgi:hypothetical protein